MLSFYINTGPERQARPPFSRLLTIKSCAAFTHDALPLSRIYVSSTHYVGLLEQALEKHAPKQARISQTQHPTNRALNRLTDQDAARIASREDFPTSFRNLAFESVTQLHRHVSQHSKNPYRPTFALINGIGTGLGDNYVGLGVLQRLIKLLAPVRPTFCLLQELEERIEPVYRHEPCVTVQPCFMPLDEFLRFDYVIDFSTIKDMPSFDEVAAAHFNSYAFSVNKLIPDTDIQPKVSTNKTKTEQIRNHINQHLNPLQKTVLLHPLASSSLRKLPSSKAAGIIRVLGEQGYNVISVFAHQEPPEHFLCLADYSKSLDDLIHIIDAADAVISVGTVVYHLASALGKPTVVMPTVEADIRSASLMPEALAWTPSSSQHLYMNLHKSERPEDLAVAEKIWRNVDPVQLISGLGKHIDACTALSNAVLVEDGKRPRVAVIIPHAPQATQLVDCLDSLSKVEGFDSQYLYTVESNGLGHAHFRYTDAFNEGINRALLDDCDYVWLLHENARLPRDYLKRLLQHFKHNRKVGIVGGREIGVQSLYDNAGLKPDYLGLRKQPLTVLKQPWISFSSCLITAELFLDVPLLDSSMQRLFCDIDFCIRAAGHGWQTWHDPTVTSEFVPSSKNTTEAPLQELTKSARQFHNKWGTHLKLARPEQIEEALLDYVGLLNSQ